MDITSEQSKIEFSEVLEQLTDENQKEVLGVLEALYFAQNKQEASVLNTEKNIYRCQ